MKMKLLALAGMALAASTCFAEDTQVDGYYKQNGTYVQPHQRSAPDSSYNNNWSVQGNQNPYTGQQGTHQPTYNDRAPASNGYGGSSRRR